jgi:hypothetical protein
MEFQLVQQAQHPTFDGAVGKCALCGEQNAPYIDASDIALHLNTPEGVRLIEGRLYICVGIEERPGCAIGIINAAGGQTPWNHAAHQEQVRVALANAAEREEIAVERIAELRRKIDEPLEREPTGIVPPLLGE